MRLTIKSFVPSLSFGMKKVAIPNTNANTAVNGTSLNCSSNLEMPLIFFSIRELNKFNVKMLKNKTIESCVNKKDIVKFDL